MRDSFVIIANIEWGFLKQRHQYLAEYLHLHGYNVIFIESSAKRNPGLSDIPRIFSRLFNVVTKQLKRSGTEMGAAKTSGVHVITPIVFPSTFTIFRLLNRLVFLKFLGRKVKSMLDRGSKVNVLCYLPSSTSLELIDSINPDKLIYDCVSNFEGIPSMPKDTVALEQELLRRSDVTLVDCDFLYNKHRYSSDNIHLMEPGVDFELFSQVVKHKHVRSGISKVGFFGLISDKIDFDLLELLNSEGYNITMIGKTQSGISVPSYISVIPAVPIEKLPELLVQFDALIIPYKKNEYTKGIIPAKFFECFATGLPIIVTKSDNYKRYEEYLITGNSNKEIVANVKSFSANKDDQVQSRLEIAKAHSWDEVIKQFVNVVV